MKAVGKFINKTKKQVTTRFSIVRELFHFMWQEKLWWMIPFAVLLLIIGVLILFAHSSPVAPFLYTLF